MSFPMKGNPGRPLGKKLTRVKTLAMEPHVAAVLTTSAKSAMMSESAWLRHIILQCARACRVCDSITCACDTKAATPDYTDAMTQLEGK